MYLGASVNLDDRLEVYPRESIHSLLIYVCVDKWMRLSVLQARIDILGLICLAVNFDFTCCSEVRQALL